MDNKNNSQKIVERKPMIRPTEQVSGKTAVPFSDKAKGLETKYKIGEESHDSRNSAYPTTSSNPNADNHNPSQGSHLMGANYTRVEVGRENSEATGKPKNSQSYSDKPLSSKMQLMYDDTAFGEDTYMLDVKDVREAVKLHKEDIDKYCKRMQIDITYSWIDLIQDIKGSRIKRFGKELCEGEK